MYVRLNSNYSDKLTNSSFLKKYNNTLYVKYSLFLVSYLFSSFFFYNGFSESFWYGHMFLSNFNVTIVLFLFFFLFLSYFIFLNTKKSNIVVNNDYYFSLLSIIIFIPFFYFSNSFFNFLFFLEIVSVLIFYKFVVSKFWFNDKFGFFKKSNILERVFSRNYLNVLFFQYWINFFSSVVLIISLINLMYIYGSTEWFFLNFLNYINNNSFSLFDLEFNIVLWVSLFSAIFIKVGITPSHLFKIEIYKGIPFVSIFFYTTYYFLGYFLLVTVLFQYYFNSFKVFFNFFMLIFLILGLFYTVFLLFDVSFAKAFFAYSTVVNSVSFIILLINNI